MCDSYLAVTRRHQATTGLARWSGVIPASRTSRPPQARQSPPPKPAAKAHTTALPPGRRRTLKQLNMRRPGQRNVCDAHGLAHLLSCPTTWSSKSSRMHSSFSMKSTCKPGTACRGVRVGGRHTQARQRARLRVPGREAQASAQGSKVCPHLYGGGPRSRCARVRTYLRHSFAAPVAACLRGGTWRGRGNHVSRGVLELEHARTVHLSAGAGPRPHAPSRDPCSAPRHPARAHPCRRRNYSCRAAPALPPPLPRPGDGHPPPVRRRANRQPQHTNLVMASDRPIRGLARAVHGSLLLLRCSPMSKVPPWPCGVPSCASVSKEEWF